jgi:hypothetical protein
MPHDAIEGHREDRRFGHALPRREALSCLVGAPGDRDGVEQLVVDRLDHAIVVPAHKRAPDLAHDGLASVQAKDPRVVTSGGVEGQLELDRPTGGIDVR